MFPALTHKFRTFLFRPKIETGIVTLTQRRIFILPTWQGIFLAFVLIVMLLGDINYNLSLGYALTFLLATVAMLSMLYAFRNLAQLQLRAGRIEPVFVSEQAQFSVRCHNGSALPRHALVLKNGAGQHTRFDVPAMQSAEIELSVPTTRRGWLSAGRLTLYTEYPLGLFHAWSYVHFDVACLVYPRVAAFTALPESSTQNAGEIRAPRGDDDFAGLRNYVAGDALPRIAWKTLAREQPLQVKQFAGAQSGQLWLDWALPEGDVEQKLQILTRWVLDAEAAGLHYGLRLPNVEILPAQGSSHKHACLRALALF